MDSRLYDLRLFRRLYGRAPTALTSAELCYAPHDVSSETRTRDTSRTHPDNFCQPSRVATKKFSGSEQISSLIILLMSCTNCCHKPVYVLLSGLCS